MNQMDRIEERYGAPLKQVLIDLWRTHRSQTTMAKVLRVSQGTISLWMARFGMEIIPTLVITEKIEPESAFGYGSVLYELVKDEEAE